MPSINVFHYADVKDHLASAHADICRLRALGVRYFQIDSVYEVGLRVSTTARGAGAATGRP